MPETDHDLIQACRKGEARAWERMLEKYERLVYSVGLKTGLTVEDAADITQVTFTILMQSLEDLRADTRLAPWLATVARRHAWRIMAKRRREPVGHVADVAESPQIAEKSTNPFETWERIEWLRMGLEKLDERCRKLLQSLYFEAEQPSYAEVAEQFDMPVGSVGPTRARCLEKLKTFMTEAVTI
ncbi:MAG TPA: sigma-70 family RNA polymerase sigma factor [Anaerolineales bacterium]|nr:sigma-70 family RNA polymerase sigma factor [Anaerolineales bacterium]